MRRARCLSIYKVHFRGDSHRTAMISASSPTSTISTPTSWHIGAACCPAFVHDVRYEDFVADQEGQTRALIAHLGLPWDDKVLSFLRPIVRCARLGRAGAPADVSRLGRSLEALW